MPYRDPEMHRARTREWIGDRRQAWIAEHGPCVVCKGTDELEVSPKPPSWSVSRDRLDESLVGSKVICRLCRLGMKKPKPATKKKKVQEPEPLTRLRGHDLVVDARLVEGRQSLFAMCSCNTWRGGPYLWSHTVEALFRVHLTGVQASRERRRARG